MKIPFVNLFYDLIFDKAPTEEQAAALVNLLGIIGALLLSMAVALPTSVESAPARNVGRRWDRALGPARARRYDEITDHVDRVKYEQAEFANGPPQTFTPTVSWTGSSRTVSRASSSTPSLSSFRCSCTCL
jgi:hypothetical protein